MASNTDQKLSENQISDIIDIVMDGVGVEGFVDAPYAALYARGRTIRDIQEYLREAFDGSDVEVPEAYAIHSEDSTPR